MSRVLVFKSMSLDGYVAGPNVSADDPMGVGGERLHDWMFGDPVASTDEKVVADLRARAAASVVGRRTFDLGLPHWKDVPFPGPSFVVTREARAPLAQAGGTFTFAPEPAEAVALAREAAGDGTVVLLGAELSRRALAAGLVDEVLLSLVPITLGGGAPLFDGTGDVTLRPAEVVGSPGVTHVRYEVVR
ncbi:dihydrofolate reductase family protein [Actinophytocola gossypii]|uniref:Dihydrofolate reductase family protein n=1 Tax=Actinophytocola gossypii TaxID=2812003 RepID=A0ABT2JAU2_9PSEU|nr:dihydrofolate reductase family protein [Actinophytocola gossypii]MCT2584987.1 dihydrofolate reductase family protein [Actinophytocola gossypii]